MVYIQDLQLEGNSRKWMAKSLVCNGRAVTIPIQRQVISCLMICCVQSMYKTRDKVPIWKTPIGAPRVLLHHKDLVITIPNFHFVVSTFKKLVNSKAPLDIEGFRITNNNPL